MDELHQALIITKKGLSWGWTALMNTRFKRNDHTLILTAVADQFQARLRMSIILDNVKTTISMESKT